MNATNLRRIFDTDLKIECCFAIGNDSKTLNEITLDVSLKEGVKRNRETVYRSLESLVKFELLEKYYDKTLKKIRYRLRFKEVKIDFVNGTITTTEV
ncbi:MAG: hypothetical protein QXU18_07115 [Thermoplasmatales archaeon]